MEELLTECMIEKLTDLQSTAILDSTESVEDAYMCDCTGCIDACTGACEYNSTGDPDVTCLVYFDDDIPS